MPTWVFTLKIALGHILLNNYFKDKYSYLSASNPKLHVLCCQLCIPDGYTNFTYSVIVGTLAVVCLTTGVPPVNWHMTYCLAW